MTGHRVLFVDDDVALLKSLCAYFDRQGHDVLTAESGEEGIRIWREEAPEVAVVDMAMPSISGFNVLETLRKDDAVVLMLTAFGDVESARRALHMGAEGFLTKPIDMDHLEHAVVKAAEKVLLRRENAELRGKVRPNLGRRALKAGLVFMLVVAALVIGTLIGG